MWMSGGPGVGKSAMMQTTCETLGSDDGSKSWLRRLGSKKGHVDGSFFFGKGLGDRENASFFPATIAYQLACSRASCSASITKAIEKQPSILDAAFPVQFRELMLKPAKGRWYFQDPLIIVVDALDECNSAADQVALLELIFEASTTTNTRFLIASRPEQAIAAFFRRKDIAQHTFHVELDDEAFNTSIDIETFLRIEFARIRLSKPDLCKSLPNGEEWPGNSVIYRVRDECDSQFIFSRLAINYIDTPHFSPDEQLQSLLKAPPPDAFSNLDTLYHRILSSRPPSNFVRDKGRVQNYEELTLSILEVVIAWPGGPFSIAQIANILKEKVDVVQNVIHGPMRSLFKFDPSDPDSPITLCHKSLRDYLLDQDRSKEFFIASSDADGLFINILSRRPPPDDRFRHYSQDVLMDVLTALVDNDRGLLVYDIATSFQFSTDAVERVICGPAKSLFEVEDGIVSFSIPSLQTLLTDSTRAGDLFVRKRDPEDALFFRMLSRQTPSDQLHSQSRNLVLLQVLTAVVGWAGCLTVSGIASVLGLASDLVETYVSRPGNLFRVDTDGNVRLSVHTLQTFLLDADRAEEYFISTDRIDGLFTQILSRQPPSDDSEEPHYKGVLMDVLTMVVVSEKPMLVRAFSGALNVSRSLVDDIIISGPTKELFKTDSREYVSFPSPFFKPFLLDSNRAGQYFISGEKMDAIKSIIRSYRPYGSAPAYDRFVGYDIWVDSDSDSEG